MSSFPEQDHEPGPGNLDVGHLALDVRRLADRLRSLAQSRIQVRLDPVPTLPPSLRVPAGDPVTRAAVAHALAQFLADAAAGVEARDAVGPPPNRLVPTLSVFAVGDQVGVTGTDVVTALRGLRTDIEVWTHGGARATADAVLESCRAAVAAAWGLT